MLEVKFYALKLTVQHDESAGCNILGEIYLSREAG
jgi:hypothetical protein